MLNEKLLEEFFEVIQDDEPIAYPENIETDLLSVAERELKVLKIPFERIKDKKNTLRLYKNSIKPVRYVKGFYPNNSRLGNLTCKDKFLTQRFLENANIKTPRGKMFARDEIDSAMEFVENSSDKLFVLKPVGMSMSLGTFLNVDSSNLKEFWIKSFEVQEKYEIKKPRVLVQEQLSGLEIRIIVLEGKIGTAIFRGPGNVIGDGLHTIEELINLKNAERKKHNYLKRNLLKINDNLLNNLSEKGITLNHILPKDECCLLYTQSNIATGREMFEVSKYLDENIFNQALDAVTAIPGTHTAGVDIFIDNLQAKEGTIIEVNQNPAFQLHYYPMTGSPTEPLKDVFKVNNIERRVLNNDINFEDLTKEEFEILIERYSFLFNKQKNLSAAFKMYLDL